MSSYNPKPTGPLVTTVAASDSSAADKFRADYTCSGSRDQILLTSVMALGGEIYLAPGTYNIDDEITLTRSDVKISGAPGTIIKAAAQAYSTLTAEAAAGTVNSIAVADGTLFKAGQIVRVCNTLHTLFDSAKITSIAGNTLNLEAGDRQTETFAFANTYAIGAHVIAVYDMLRIYGTSGTYLDNLVVEGVEFDGNYANQVDKLYDTTGGDTSGWTDGEPVTQATTGAAGIMLNMTAATAVVRLIVVPTNNIAFGLGYEITGTTSGKKMTPNASAEKRFGTGEVQVDVYENAVRLAYINDITIHNCRFINVMYNSVLAHGGPVHNVNLLHNTVRTVSTQTQSRGFALEASSNTFIVDGNSLYGYATAADDCKGIYCSGHSSEAVSGKIINNFISNWGTGIGTFADAKNIIIAKNNIVGAMYYGIYIAPTGSTPVCADIIISENNVSVSGAQSAMRSYGIRTMVVNNKFTVPTGINSILDYGTDNVYLNNHFYSAGTIGYGLLVQTGSTGVRSSGNVMLTTYNYHADTRTYVAGTVTLSAYLKARLNSAAGAITATLPDAGAGDVGLTVTIVMVDATTASTVAITHHDVEDGIIANFNAVDDTLTLIWTGTEWSTVKGTCLFNTIADPGDGAAIPVVTSGKVSLESTAAQTRTLAAPTYKGQEMMIYFLTDGGDITLTCATTLNSTGNNTATFATAGQSLRLLGVEVGSAILWRIAVNTGTVALATV